MMNYCSDIKRFWMFYILKECFSNRVKGSYLVIYPTEKAKTSKVYELSTKLRFAEPHIRNNTTSFEKKTISLCLVKETCVMTGGWVLVLPAGVWSWAAVVWWSVVGLTCTEPCWSLETTPPSTPQTLHMSQTHLMTEECCAITQFMRETAQHIHIKRHESRCTRVNVSRG